MKSCFLDHAGGVIFTPFQVTKPLTQLFYCLLPRNSGMKSSADKRRSMRLDK